MGFNVYQSSGGKLVLTNVMQTKSLVWEERFNDIGKMQVVFPKDTASMDAVKVGYFASVDESPLLYYIYGTKMTDDELWAYGYECKALLQKMKYDSILSGVYQGEINVRNALRSACVDYVDYSFVYDAQDSLSYFPDLVDVGTANLDASDVLDMYSLIQAACALKGCGWWMQYNQANRKLVINGRQGEDKSGTVMFSTQLGNAWGVRYTLSDQPYVHTVYAYGLDAVTDPDYPEIVVESASTTQVGDEHTAAIIDLRVDFPRPEDMTLTDYKSALQNRANMSLIARHAQEKLEVENVDTSGYGTAYILGDIVSVFVPEYNVTYKMRLAGITHTAEGNYDSIKFALSAI